jgi:hypothetical protein
MGNKFHVPNLSQGAFKLPAFPVSGQIYGNRRYMAPLVVQRLSKPTYPIFNVWFLVDTGSPITSITKKTFETIMNPKAEIGETFKISIQVCFNVTSQSIQFYV